jgi:SAM-dependent methyltransferase
VRQEHADPARIGYAGAGEAWSTGASLAYVPLAAHLVDACAEPLLGALALDAGAGTGAATSALRRRGARVVATDVQEDMLRAGRCATNAAVADITALPFRDAPFDIAVGAFVLNHLADAAAGLAEMSRVCRRGGVVLASTFSADRSAVKSIVDEVAAAYGWIAPDWYGTFRDRASRLGSVDQMTRVAAVTGLDDIVVTESEVEIGLDDPSNIARYRLGMPQLAPFARDLPERRRQEFHDDVVAAIAASGEPLRPAVIELVARAR